MKTLAQFKSELGVDSIQFLKNESGRQYAEVGKVKLFISPKLDMNKPMFVTIIEKDKNGNKLENVYSVCNTSLVNGVVL